MRPFNDTTNLTGLVQGYELEIGADQGFVSGSTTRLKQFASATRSAWNRYLELALKAGGRWQYDDSNHTDYPIIEGDLVANQRDVTFVSDETGNLVIDIYRVFVKDTGGVYQEIFPVNEREDRGTEDFTDGQDRTGVPSSYSKTGNGIRFDVLPSHSWRLAQEGERGVKIYINRTPSYFTHTDTTKKPGCPAVHHDYFFLRPALDAARRGDKANYNRLYEAVISFEGDEEKGVQGSIERYFSRRARDERPRITPKITPYL